MQMDENTLTNPMRDILIEKVTISLGLGGSGERMENIKNYCENLFGRKFMKTLARKRNPTFKLKKRDEIGIKCTFRGAMATEVLKKSLHAARNKIKASSFDKIGNFSFGVKEYIEYPGAKYDSEIGLFGFDVCVTFKRRGFRITDKKIRNSKVGKKHITTQKECMEFMKKNFGTDIQ